MHLGSLVTRKGRMEDVSGKNGRWRRPPGGSARVLGGGGEEGGFELKSPGVMGDGCVSGGFLDRKGAGMRAEGGGGLNSFTSFGGNLYSTPLVPGKPHRLLWGGFGFKS